MGYQYPNLSVVSLASPISSSVLNTAASKAGANYLGQVNDWRDPVTNPKLWVAGSAALLAGGAAAGVALAPATGGGSLYVYGVSLIGGGAIVYGINNYHSLEKYMAKPAIQSIMFERLKNNPR